MVSSRLAEACSSHADISILKLSLYSSFHAELLSIIVLFLLFLFLFERIGVNLLRSNVFFKVVIRDRGTQFFKTYV